MPTIKYRNTQVKLLAIRSTPLQPVSRPTAARLAKPILAKPRPRPVPVPLRPKVEPVQLKIRTKIPKQHRQILNSKERVTRSLPATKGISASDTVISSLGQVGVGRILLIIGNGPSHAEADLPRLAVLPNVDIMSINKPDKRLWPTKYWLFCDNSQQKRHSELWSNYTGTIINSIAVRILKENCIKVRTVSGKGFSLNLLKGMHIGRSSVYAALQVAVWMKYDHIYVFGVDMTAVNGKLYPWGSNPDVADKTRAERFVQEATHYNWMADNVSSQIRSKITFCTRYNPHAFIHSFENLDHVTAIDTIISRHASPSQS